MAGKRPQPSAPTGETADPKSQNRSDSLAGKATQLSALAGKADRRTDSLTGHAPNLSALAGKAVAGETGICARSILAQGQG